MRDYLIDALDRAVRRHPRPIGGHCTSSRAAPGSSCTKGQLCSWPRQRVPFEAYAGRSLVADAAARARELIDANLATPARRRRAGPGRAGHRCLPAGGRLNEPGDQRRAARGRDQPPGACVANIWQRARPPTARARPRAARARGRGQHARGRGQHARWQRTRSVTEGATVGRAGGRRSSVVAARGELARPAPRRRAAAGLRRRLRHRELQRALEPRPGGGGAALPAQGAARRADRRLGHGVCLRRGARTRVVCEAPPWPSTELLIVEWYATHMREPGVATAANRLLAHRRPRRRPPAALAARATTSPPRHPRGPQWLLGRPTPGLRAGGLRQVAAAVRPSGVVVFWSPERYPEFEAVLAESFGDVQVSPAVRRRRADLFDYTMYACRLRRA